MSHSYAAIIAASIAAFHNTRVCELSALDSRLLKLGLGFAWGSTCGGVVVVVFTAAFDRFLILN